MPSRGHPRESGEDGTVGITKRRAARLVVALIPLLIAGGLAGWFGWQAHERRQALAGVERVAQQVASGLHTGTLPDAIDVTDRAGAEKRLAVIYRGMGEVRPAVTVRDVRLDADGESGTARLEQTWTFHAGQPAWTYATQVRARHTGNGWVAQWSDEVVAPGLRTSEGLRAARLTAERGEILGDSGKPLVMERPVVRVGLDRSRLTDDGIADSAARTLAALVDVNPGTYAGRVRAAGPQAFVEAIVYRAQSPEAIAISQAAERVPGLRLVADTLPLAPSASFARPVFGVAGQATAEVIEKSGGRVRVGDVVGLSGLQAAYDEQLFGRSGFVVEAVDQTTWKTRQLFKVQPVTGAPVRVTLNEKIQAAADAVLAHVEPASALVAIRPSDGHLLAIASGPGGEGYSTATLGEYAPGSTFKTVSALALMRAGVSPDSSVDCAASISVDGRLFHNYADYPATSLGQIPLREALAQSCNTAFVGEQSRLSEGALASAAAALGMTAEPSLGIPATMATVPSPPAGVDRAAAMIGQGTVLASPLAMATAAASIAKGAAVSPVLVLDRAKSSRAVDAPLTGSEAEALRAMMRQVVTAGSGTGLAGVPGEPVLAKTGTAEYGTDDPPRTRAWVIAIHGDLAVAAFVADGTSGGRVAAPLVAEFLTRIAR